MSMILKKASSLVIARRAFSSSAEHHDSVALWKKLSIYMAVPCVVIMSTYNFMNMASGEGHERPEFIAYDHLRIRNKRFPWGDGQKSLFHNPHVNPLPDGYEEDHH